MNKFTSNDEQNDNDSEPDIDPVLREVLNDLDTFREMQRDRSSQSEIGNGNW